MKKILAAIATLMALIAMLSGCGGQDAPEKLIMGTEVGFAPYEYMNGNEIAGVDIDISYEIAKDMGRELVIQNMDFDGALLAVQQGKVDFVAAGVSVSEEREKLMDFSITYAVSEQVIIVNKDTPQVSGESDINGSIVGVQQGNIADIVLTEDYDCGEIKRYTKFLQAAEDLKNNKIDCIVMDSLPAQEMVKANPELEILPDVLFTDYYAIAVQKGNTELLEKINATIQRLIDSGKIEEYTLYHTTK